MDDSVKGRSDEEIGSKHVDDGRKNIEVDEFKSAE